MNNLKFAFFGTSNFSVFCLEELKTLGFLPTLIITTPDKPAGRKLILTPTPVKIWAQKNKIECLTPEKLDSYFTLKLSVLNLPLFLVASYGKIIPKNIVDLPKNGILNIHPSLLPKYRGPSPLQTQILNGDKEVGVSIIKIDEQVDHGSLVTQKKIILDNILNFNDLEKKLAEEGSKLFVKILPDWITENLETKDQNHEEATFTKKIKKTDGLIDIEKGDPYKNYLKFLAYSAWPQVYFFIKKKHNLTPALPLANGREKEKIRVIIKEAEFKDDKFIIKKVLPEGKKEMSYADFLRGLI